MKWLHLLAASCALAQSAREPAPSPGQQRAAMSRQQDAARKQAQAVGAWLLPWREVELVPAVTGDPPCDPMDGEVAGPIIEAAAKTHELDSRLLRAVIE